VTGVAWLLLGAAAVVAVANWVAVDRRNKPLEYATKPAVMVALLGVALALDPETSSTRAWFVAALAFSLAGDVFLMLPRDLFVPGLASFLVAHVCYVAGFLTEDLTAAGWVAGAVVVAVALATLGRRVLGAVRSGDEPGLTPPVAAYMVVISAMLAAACATGDPRAVAGAALFYGSDSLIAWNRFVEPLAWGPVAIMVTYHLGQALLVLSLP
jgi:uncharacterized membrane protein YhhN